MAKKNLHPEIYKTKFFCDGILILEIPGTKKEIHVEIWSGNHPFYTKTQKIIDIEGKIQKFQKKYSIFQLN